jgi:hypothetical protein
MGLITMNDNQNRQPKGTPTGGRFAASTKAEARVDINERCAPDEIPECGCAMTESSQAHCLLHGYEAVCPDCGEPWADHQEPATASRRLNELTSVDEFGRRWVETEADWYAAEDARLRTTARKQFTDLRPGDRFVSVQGDRLIENRVLSAPVDELDRHGDPMRFVEVRRSNGSEGLHRFESSETAATVEPPVNLRVDPAKQLTERDLNEGFGV